MGPRLRIHCLRPLTLSLTDNPHEHTSSREEDEPAAKRQKGTEAEFPEPPKINPAAELEAEVKPVRQKVESAAATEAEKPRYPSVREVITAVKQYLVKYPHLGERAPEDQQATLDLLSKQYLGNQITMHQVTLRALQTAVISLVPCHCCSWKCS